MSFTFGSFEDLVSSGTDGAGVVPVDVTYEESDLAKSVRDFVYFYYRTLVYATNDVWRVFTASANYTHVEGEVNVDICRLRPAFGQQEIHINITQQEFFRCQFRIFSIVLQQQSLNGTDSDGGTVTTVMVTGDVSRDQGPYILFTQSFVLERWRVTHQYAIRHSVFKVFSAIT